MPDACPCDGYLTSYARNVLGRFTAAAQSAQSASRKICSFQYDELGRLTEATNPETKQLPVYLTCDSDAARGTGPRMREPP